MFVAYVDVVVFVVLFPCCAYLFKVVGLRPSRWCKRGRAYCRRRDGYGALSMHDEDEEDRADLLQMQPLGGSGGDDARDDAEQDERGTLLGGSPRRPKDEKKAARLRDRALKKQRHQAEKRRKRQERRQKSNSIWMKAMADYTTSAQEKHKAALNLMDAYHPGLKARAARVESDESCSDDEEASEPEPEPEPGSISFLLADHRLERWAAKLEGIGVEEIEDLTLIEPQDLESLGMNKLERVRFMRCVEQLRSGCSVGPTDSSDGTGITNAAAKRVAFGQESRPVGATPGERWDQSKEIGGGVLELGAHGWWRIDNDDEQLAHMDHAGRGWIDGRPATFALENDDEEFEKTMKSLRQCECCPSVLNCVVGGGVAWFVTSVVMLVYVYMQSSICPSGAAGPATPVLQASPAWGQIQGTKAGEERRRIRMEDLQIELFRSRDAGMSSSEVSEGARLHAWLTTVQVDQGVGSTLKVVYCPSGGRSLAQLEEEGAIDEIVTGASNNSTILSD